jgi:hypothetical protein
MSPLARIRQAAACTVWAFLASVTQAANPAPAAEQPVLLAPKATAQIAHSALLTVEATTTGDSLRLTIRRTHDQSLVNGSDISVSVDGRNEPVTPGSAGYEIPINDLRGAADHDPPREVEIIVPHDGIRELVSGKVTATEGSSGGSLLGDHKQIAWWILNIVVVLIAAMAISRRKS